MKRFGKAILIPLLLFTLSALGGTALAAEGRVYNLNMTGGYMDEHPTVQNAFFALGRAH